MLVCQGKGICDGIAIGKIKLLKKNTENIKRVHIDDIEKELIKFNNARENSKKQLLSLCVEAETDIGKENAAIFEIHSMMIDDADYIESIEFNEEISNDKLKDIIEAEGYKVEGIN